MIRFTCRLVGSLLGAEKTIKTSIRLGLGQKKGRPTFHLLEMAAEYHRRKAKTIKAAAKEEAAKTAKRDRLGR